MSTTKIRVTEYVSLDSNPQPDPAFLFVMSGDPKVRANWSHHFRQPYVDCVAITAVGGAVSEGWTTSGRKRGIDQGKDAYLWLTGKQAGLIGKGTATGRLINQWVGIDWDRLLMPEDRLRRQTLEQLVPHAYQWPHVQASGCVIDPAGLADLALLWKHHLAFVDARKTP